MTSKKADIPDIQLASLVDPRSAEAAFEEVKNNFIRFYPIAEFDLVRRVFRDFRDLFDGRYPGYRSCNTRYHDKVHSTDTLLAISRLIDGYNLTKRPKLPMAQVRIALIATLLHDSGFIQTDDDIDGTGAKYTREHINRSIHFMNSYFPKAGLGRKELRLAEDMVRCTGVNVDLETIPFADRSERILGYMLGSSDLLGQMSGRNYLEKLFLLFNEFREGAVTGYESELDLLEKSIDFWAQTKKRLSKDLAGVYNYARFHFAARYGIKQNLYEEAIRRQMNYLVRILQDKSGLHNHLRRHGG